MIINRGTDKDSDRFWIRYRNRDIGADKVDVTIGNVEYKKH